MSGIGWGRQQPEALLSLDARSHRVTFSGPYGYFDNGPDYFLPIKMMEILGSSWKFCFLVEPVL